MPKLTFPDTASSPFSFESDIVVGRGRQADLRIDDPSVSRAHAKISCQDRQFFVEDLASVNGTLLNGRPISTSFRLTSGDRLTFGVVDAFYDEAPAPDEPVALPIAETTSHVVLSVPIQEARPYVQEILDPSLIQSSIERRVRFFNELAKVTGLSFDEDRLLTFVIDQLFGLFPQVERAILMTVDRHTGQLVARVARSRHGLATDMPVSHTLIQDAIRKTEAILVVDEVGGARYPDSDSIRLAGIRSAICTPLVFDGQTYGVLQVDNGGSAPPLGRGDVELARAIACQLGMALGYTRIHRTLVDQRLLEHDLEFARRIQQQFFPERPTKLAGFAFDVSWLPALTIGGDFYDFLKLGPSLVGMVVGDVSGKGISAALYGARVTSELRYVATDPDPAAILSRLDERLSSMTRDGMFVTAAIGVLDGDTGRLSIATAGHPRPLLLQTNGRVSALGCGGGTPLGVGHVKPYTVSTHDFNPGDVVIFYTDGIIDALDPQQEPFGYQRLEAVIRGARTSATVHREIIAAVTAHAADEPPFDDITVLSVTRSETVSGAQF